MAMLLVKITAGFILFCLNFARDEKYTFMFASSWQLKLNGYKFNIQLCLRPFPLLVIIFYIQTVKIVNLLPVFR